MLTAAVETYLALRRSLGFALVGQGADFASPEHLIEALGRVRRVTVARSVTGTGRMRITSQLEDIEPQLRPLLPALGITQ